MNTNRSSNTADQQILQARDFSEARAQSDPYGRVRLVHDTGTDSPSRLPANALSWFKTSRTQRTIMLVLSICGAILILATVMLLVVFMEHWWIALVVAAGEILALTTLLRMITKTSARKTRKPDLSEVDFLGAQPQQGTVVRVWPKFYEGDFVDLTIAVELPAQRTGTRALLVTAGETAGPRDEVVKLLPEQLPREGDPAWVWRAGSDPVVTAIQAAIRRPGQA